MPPLSIRLDIDNYAVKLNRFAVHFCAILNDKLIGFSGCYFNDPFNNIAFISSLSIVREFQRKGVSKKLLTTIIQFGIKKGFCRIRLQVHVSNKPALRLYSGNGFLETSRNMNQIEMVLNLENLKS